MWSQIETNKDLGFRIDGFAEGRVPPGHSREEEIDQHFSNWLFIFGLPAHSVELELVYQDGGRGLNWGSFQEMLALAKDRKRGVVSSVELRLRPGVRVDKYWKPPPIEPLSRFEREDVV